MVFGLDIEGLGIIYVIDIQHLNVKFWNYCIMPIPPFCVLWEINAFPISILPFFFSLNQILI
jgi:hypothetical protein